MQLTTAGVITGCGVASMHYLGMAAMNVGTHISYDPMIVALSVVIAVVAATAALWAALRAEGTWFTAGAALVMGIAVSSMHYTGMAAMTAHHTSGISNPVTGAAPINVIIPLMMGIIVVATVIFAALLLSPDITELRQAALTSAPLASLTEKLRRVLEWSSWRERSGRVATPTRHMWADGVAASRRPFCTGLICLGAAIGWMWAVAPGR